MGERKQTEEIIDYDFLDAHLAKVAEKGREALVPAVISTDSSPAQRTKENRTRMRAMEKAVTEKIINRLFSVAAEKNYVDNKAAFKEEQLYTIQSQEFAALLAEMSEANAKLSSRESSFPIQRRFSSELRRLEKWMGRDIVAVRVTAGGHTPYSRGGVNEVYIREMYMIMRDFNSHMAREYLRKFG